MVQKFFKLILYIAGFKSRANVTYTQKTIHLK